MLPPWLPHILNLDGAWENALKILYKVFDNDFIKGKPDYLGCSVIWDNRKLDGKYEEGFWHLISKEDYESGERYADYRRAERLPWCAPTICICPEVAVTSWDYREGSGKVRTYLWLRSWDYVVVLEKLKNPYLLVTAYYVNGASTRRKLEKKYDNRIT